MTGAQLKRKLIQAGLHDIQDEDFATRLGLTRRKLEKLYASIDVRTHIIETIVNEFNLSYDYLMTDDIERENQFLGDIVVNRGPVKIRQTQHELNINLEDGEELKYLVVVSIRLTEKHGLDIDFCPIEQYQKFEWHRKGEGGTIFFLFKSEKECLIRYFDENFNLHDQFIGDYGYRIIVESRRELKLCLCKDRDLIESHRVTISNFIDIFNLVWDKYIDASKNIHDNNQQH